MHDHLKPWQFALYVLIWAMWPLLVLPYALTRAIVAGLREAFWDLGRTSPREELAGWLETGRRIGHSLRDLWRRKLAGKEPGGRNG